jgi:hypothetical protein
MPCKAGGVLRVVGIVVLFVAVGALALVAGAALGWWIARAQAAILLRQRRRAVEALLPPDAGVVALVPALTPAATSRRVARAVGASLPLVPLGMIPVPTLVLMRRGRSKRLLAVGADHVWALSTAKRSSRPVALLGSAPRPSAAPERRATELVVVVGDEELGVPLPYRRALAPAT